LFALERDRFTRAALGGQELDRAQGEAVLDHHLPHYLADRTGRAHDRNAWYHVQVPFVTEKETPVLSVLAPADGLARESGTYPSSTTSVTAIWPRKHTSTSLPGRRRLW